MKSCLIAIAVAATAPLLATSCSGATNDEAEHTYVTCDPSWGSNVTSDKGITRCEAACQSYIDETNSDTCEGTLWDHTNETPNTQPDGAAGCAGVVVIDGLRGCCNAVGTEIDFVVCDAGQ